MGSSEVLESLPMEVLGTGRWETLFAPIQTASPGSISNPLQSQKQAGKGQTKWHNQIHPTASGGRPSKLQEQIKQKPPGRAKRRTAIPKGTKIPFNRSWWSCRDLNLSSPHYLLIGPEAELSLQCATQSPRHTVQNVAQRGEEFTSNYSVCGHEVLSGFVVVVVSMCVSVCLLPLLRSGKRHPLSGFAFVKLSSSGSHVKIVDLFCLSMSFSNQNLPLYTFLIVNKFEMLFKEAEFQVFLDFTATGL